MLNFYSYEIAINDDKMCDQSFTSAERQFVVCLIQIQFMFNLIALSYVVTCVLFISTRVNFKFMFDIY